MFLPSRLGAGIIAALLLLPAETIPMRLVFGVVYGGVILSVNVLHIIGHTLSARLVGGPIDENVILQNHIRTSYLHDPPDLPSRIHIGRALGGPVMNLLVGLPLLIGWSVWGGHVLLFGAVMHLLNGLGLLLLPVPGADGETLWREGLAALRRKS